MIKLKNVLKMLTRFFVYSIIIFFIDLIFIIFLTEQTNQIIYNLSFLMLLEGGIGLVVGGIIVSYSPSVAKMSEVFFKSEPWNFTRQKQIEKNMIVLILTGFFLIIESILLSAF